MVQQNVKHPYEMKFDAGTIKHLGLQMYSTLPSVIGELVANAWDANAKSVAITIPDKPLDQTESEIIILDDGIGMSDNDVRNKYIITGRDRRESENTDDSPPPLRRKIMGRKGIGKFSSFGIAKEIEVESVKNSVTSRFIMNYDDMMAQAAERAITFDSLSATGTITEGTKITLRQFTKFKTRAIGIASLRKHLARRFSVIGDEHRFQVIINGEPITPEERNLQSLLDIDVEGNPYIWEYDNARLCDEEDWTVSGWIGAIKKTTSKGDAIEGGIVLMARGKLVQEPFLFDVNVGQQYALAYIVGELHVEFVDEVEDSIGTNRNVLVWDTEPNQALKKWGQHEINQIARAWAEKRNNDNEVRLEQNQLYQDFQRDVNEIGNTRATNLVDKLVRKTIAQNPATDLKEIEPTIQMGIDFLEFDAFLEIAEELRDADNEDIGAVLKLLREWQVVEAREMARVAEGRVEAIRKLQAFIDGNAREIPTLHMFLKEFPWVIDPHWTLVADEKRYSDVLREKYPDAEKPEKDRRIDFLCVKDGNGLCVVEIKRPGKTVSKNELQQIEDYTSFMRHHVLQGTDPDYQVESVKGYLLCGQVASSPEVSGKKVNLQNSGIYVRLYSDMLDKVERLHRDFIDRYDRLREVKSRSAAGVEYDLEAATSRGGVVMVR